MIEGNAVIRSAVDARGVATLTLNRPGTGNAYDRAMLTALADALATLAVRPDVRLLVLRGAGRHFQAGPDFGWLSEGGRLSDLVGTVDYPLQRLAGFPHPRITVVQGACYGLGCSLACCTDLVLASSAAIFELGEGRGAAPVPLSRYVIDALGSRHARRLAVAGNRFDAQEAHRIGLVHEVIPAKELEARLASVIDAELGGTKATDSRIGPHAAAGPVLGAGRTASSTQDSWSQRSTGGVSRSGHRSFPERRKPGWLLSSDQTE